jgi:poly-beta-1,6-N-acetyl-D-glucosamine synthase
MDSYGLVSGASCRPIVVNGTAVPASPERPVRPQPPFGWAAQFPDHLKHATGELVFFIDVRQPIEPDALKHLVANFADPTVGAVTGELRLLKGEMGEQADMDLYWRYEVWARTRHSEIDSLFTATGCIYVQRRSLVQSIPPDTISDDAIMPLRAFFRGYRVVFDPEAVAYDYPALPGNEFRRRLRTLAGLWQVHARLPELFTSANRMRFHFLSHKFARLILPWALLTTVLATLALPPSSFRSILAVNELLLFAVALMDMIVARNFPLRRLSSPARSFLVMNAAALISVVVFFVPANRLWAPTRVKQA